MYYEWFTHSVLNKPKFAFFIKRCGCYVACNLHFGQLMDRHRGLWCEALEMASRWALLSLDFSKVQLETFVKMSDETKTLCLLIAA